MHHGPMSQFFRSLFPFSRFFSLFLFLSLSIYLSIYIYLFFSICPFSPFFFFLENYENEATRCNWSMGREIYVTWSSLRMYMVTILLRRQNRLTRKSSIVFAKTDDIFLGWNFSLEMVDQFFFGPSDRIIPYAEPSHSLDGEAEAYIEANGATLGDSSPPDPFPFYVFFPFLIIAFSTDS